MSRASRILKRLTISACLVTAFLVMASVFSPDESTASGPHYDSSSSDSSGIGSADAHSDLRSLGVFEGVELTIHVFATDGGPRYSVQDRQTGEMRATLVGAEQAQKLFPEVSFPSVDFSAQGEVQHLMTAETSAIDW